MDQGIKDSTAPEDPRNAPAVGKGEEERGTGKGGADEECGG